MQSFTIVSSLLVTVSSQKQTEQQISETTALLKAQAPTKYETLNSDSITPLHDDYINKTLKRLTPETLKFWNKIEKNITNDLQFKQEMSRQNNLIEKLLVMPPKEFSLGILTDQLANHALIAGLMTMKSYQLNSTSLKGVAFGLIVKAALDFRSNLIKRIDSIEDALLKNIKMQQGSYFNLQDSTNLTDLREFIILSKSQIKPNKEGTYSDLANVLICYYDKVLHFADKARAIYESANAVADLCRNSIIRARINQPKTRDGESNYYSNSAYDNSTSSTPILSNG